jgi:ATP-binding cassette, subfamily B, bacterial
VAERTTQPPRDPNEPPRDPSAPPRDAAAPAEARPFTLEALDTRGGPGGWRQLPHTARDALRLVRRAAPRELLATQVLQALTAAALGGQLLLAKTVLQELIAANRGEGELSGLLPEFLLLVGVILVMGVLNAGVQLYSRLLIERVGIHVLDELIRVANLVKLEAFESPVFYDQLLRARTAGIVRPVEMVNSLTTVSTALLTSVGIGVVLFTIAPVLLPLVILAAVPLLLSSLLNSQRTYRFEYLLTPRNRERSYLMEVLTGREAAQEIRAFNATRYLRERYDALTAERLGLLQQFVAGRFRVSAVAAAAGAVGFAIALGSLAVLLGTDRIDIAAAVTAGVSMQLLNGRMGALFQSAGKLVETGLFLDDFRLFLKLGERESAQSEPAPPPHPDAAPQFGGVELHDVSFAYPNTDRTVLHEVSLRVDPGEIVALVGENGSGKTTLVKLMCGLYEPASGSVAWGGTPYEDLDPAEVRSQITVLFQDFLRYQLTVEDNIALGRVERPPDAATLEQAAQRAGAHGFIEKLPLHYRTRLGRQFYGGHELSLGQWQRLALARAFYRDGGFLILDEPTASLDPKAEAALFEQMRRLAQGRSVLLISHRFSSVRTADRIYVLDEGRVVETGSHEELMALDGQYAHLFSLQARAYLTDAPAHQASPDERSPA